MSEAFYTDFGLIPAVAQNRFMYAFGRDDGIDRSRAASRGIPGGVMVLEPGSSTMAGGFGRFRAVLLLAIEDVTPGEDGSL